MTFEFRNIDIYKKANLFHKQIKKILNDNEADRVISDQLNRASLSIILNVAEGYGRFHKADKRNFYVNSRASLNECVACLDVIFDSDIPQQLLNDAEELGKMLSGLINRFKE